MKSPLKNVCRSHNGLVKMMWHIHSIFLCTCLMMIPIPCCIGIIGPGSAACCVVDEAEDIIQWLKPLTKLSHLGPQNWILCFHILIVLCGDVYACEDFTVVLCELRHLPHHFIHVFLLSHPRSPCRFAIRLLSLILSLIHQIQIQIILQIPLRAWTLRFGASRGVSTGRGHENYLFIYNNNNKNLQNKDYKKKRGLKILIKTQDPETLIYDNYWNFAKLIYDDY